LGKYFGQKKADPPKEAPASKSGSSSQTNGVIIIDLF